TRSRRSSCGEPTTTTRLSLCSSTCPALSLRRRFCRDAEQAPYRRNEVIRACEWVGVARQGIARPVIRAGHALEHVLERPLLGGEADEHRPVVGHGAVRHVAAEDLAERV